MKRRDALKVIALSGVAVSMASAYDKELIVNTENIKIQDPKNPTDFEKKHLPDISIKDKDSKGYTLIEITVGQGGIIHPSDKDHWVYKIDLFADDKLIGFTELEPVISRGYYSTRVKLDGVKELKSTAYCNQHGNFTATKKL